MRTNWVHSISPRAADRGAIADLEARQRDTERANARLLLEAICRDERYVDCEIAAQRTWSDRWWRLLKRANALRTRRIEVEGLAK